MSERGGPAGAAIRCGLPLALGALTFLAFLPGLQNGFVAWDDDMNFIENPFYRGFSWRSVAWAFGTTLGGHWQPLSWLTLTLDWTLWGLDARGYHLTSLVLHVGNALWCYLLALALLARAGDGIGPVRLRLAAAAAACLFAVHPLRVESVTWVSERRDVLSGFFWLPTLLAYVHMTESRGRARGAWLALSLGCFVCSLLSKAWGITLPVVLLVLDAYPLGRVGREPLARLLREKLPYAACALVAAVAAFQAQHPVEAMRTLAHHGVAARAAQAAYGLWFYLWKSVVPLGLHPAYLLELQLDPTRPLYLAAMAAVLGLTVALVRLRYRAPWALAAWVAYAAIVSPVLSIVQTGPQIAADRYTYLACVPWALVVGGALGTVRRGAWSAGLATAAVVVALAGLTSRQTRVWQDSATLWNHVIRVDPENFVAYVNRGVTGGDPRRGLADFSEAIRLNPRYPLAFYNRGGAHHVLGDYDAAIADFSEAIRLKPGDPQAWNDRGWARQAKGDWAGAVADYTEALARAPEGWDGRFLIAGNLARARRGLAAQGGLTPPGAGP